MAPEESPDREEDAATAGGPAETEAEGVADAGERAGHPSEADEGWRFSLEDLPSDDGDGAGVAGSLRPSEDIEPGEIDPESALFFVLGVAVALVGLWLMLVP